MQANEIIGYCSSPCFRLAALLAKKDAYCSRSICGSDAPFLPLLPFFLLCCDFRL